MLGLLDKNYTWAPYLSPTCTLHTLYKMCIKNDKKNAERTEHLAASNSVQCFFKEVFKTVPNGIFKPYHRTVAYTSMTQPLHAKDVTLMLKDEMNVFFP